MKNEKIYTQHSENVEWKENAAFYRDEIRIMENRLAEIASKNTSKEILAQVEHFQNQLIIQKERISELKHEIHISEDALEREIKRNSTAVDHRKMEDHTAARDKMQSFEKVFVSLRTEFNGFLEKTM